MHQANSKPPPIPQASSFVKKPSNQAPVKELKVYKPEDYFKKEVHKDDDKGAKRKNKAEYESKEERFERNLGLMDESF
jgi:hypothetical protein